MEREDVKARIENFLEKTRRLQDSALIFTPASLKGLVVNRIKEIFKDKPITFLSSSHDEGKIDKIFKASLKKGNLLVVTIDKTTPPVVLRRLEQIFEDGYFSYSVGSTWHKVEPVEGWQCLVWINRDHIKEDQFIPIRLFPIKLVVEG